MIEFPGLDLIFDISTKCPNEIVDNYVLYLSFFSNLLHVKKIRNRRKENEWMKKK
jgi:hypothetical protein